MKCALLALAFSASSAAAQTFCTITSDMLAGLATGYGEHVVGSGISGGSLMQITANPETGTWTLLASTPDGTSCILAAGTDWSAARLPPNL